MNVLDHIGHNKPVTGSRFDDVIDGTSMQGFGQLHVFAYGGDDHLILRFGDIQEFSHGHHVRGESRDGKGEGKNVFEFADIHRVNDTIVGRIEDFDYSRDKIVVDGEVLDLADLPANIRLVRYNGEHNDPQNEAQLWIHIRTPGGGDIFYALEGARIDLDTSLRGGAQGGTQEAHFLGTEPNIDNWSSVPFLDPLNYVPEGLSLGKLGGVIINDIDITPANVRDIIHGTGTRDLIAGGINGDTIFAGGGNDWVSGGSGYDSIRGGSGNDMLRGASGNDTIKGEEGNDSLTGGNGRDFLYGGPGDDFLSGWGDNDWLWAGSGNDRLNGGPGNDALFAGAGTNTMIGGVGEDVFIFNSASDKMIINDFQDDIDSLRVLNMDENTVAEVMQIARHADFDGDGDADLILEFDNGGEIVLLDMTAAQLRDDLIFA